MKIKRNPAGGSDNPPLPLEKIEQFESEARAVIAGLPPITTYLGTAISLLIFKQRAPGQRQHTLADFWPLWRDMTRRLDAHKRKAGLPLTKWECADAANPWVLADLERITDWRQRHPAAA